MSLRAFAAARDQYALVVLKEPAAESVPDLELAEAGRDELAIPQEESTPQVDPNGEVPPVPPIRSPKPWNPRHASQEDVARESWFG